MTNEQFSCKKYVLFYDEAAITIIVCTIGLALAMVPPSATSVLAADEPTELIEPDPLRTLPRHWKCQALPTIDTRLGEFVSSQSELTIRYEIGAGEDATLEQYPKAKWIKKGQIKGSKYNYLLTKEGKLVITFPSEGPANFIATVKNKEEIAFVLTLVTRHRKELLGKEKRVEYPLK